MKKKIGLLLVVLLSLFALPVNAASKNGFYADQNLKLDKEIAATTFAAGNFVDVSSNIDGMAFVAGNNVNVSSSQDYLFVAGNMITIDGASAKDVFAAGSSVKVTSSNVRDLFATAAEVVIDSDISRNAYIGGDKVTINSKIEGDVKVASESLTIGKDAVITGTLSYPEGAKVEFAEGSTVFNKETYETPEVEVSNKTVFQVIAFEVVNFIKKVCRMILIGLLLLLLCKNLFEDLKAEEKSFENVAKKFGLGFAVLCLTPIAFILTLITIVGAPIGVIGMLFYGILLYLSAIPTAYFFGKMVFDDKLGNDYLMLTISIIILYVINKITFIGAITSFLSLCIGLGFYASLIYNYVKKNNKKEAKNK